MVSGPVLLKIKGKSWNFMNKWKSQPCFDTKSVRFGRTELSLFWRTPRREIYNLGMVSGPVLSKIKGKSWMFIFWGFKQKRKKWKQNDEICEMLVSWALDRSKKMRKLVADRFPKSPAWKTQQKTQTSKKSLQSSRPDQKDPQDRRGYFCKIWAWKTLKKEGQIKIVSGFFPIFPVDFAKNPWIPVA